MGVISRVSVGCQGGRWWRWEARGPPLGPRRRILLRCSAPRPTLHPASAGKARGGASCATTSATLLGVFPRGFTRGGKLGGKLEGKS